MARLRVGLVGGILLASVTLGVGAADSEFCLADSETSGPCPLGVESAADPSLATTPADTSSLPADAVLPDVQPAPAVTRTLNPPTVEQPFADVAATAAQVDEVPPARIQPADQPKLPPGPPSRVP
ncbi:MAG TPA: hypothetical protein VKV73_17820 [Chloroflexota bacterium]|nr:hypothetical protein [Chloroflexota bacterium]